MTEKTKKVNDGMEPKDNKTVKSQQNMEFEDFVVNTAVYKTLLTTKYKNRKKWEQANEKHIISFIPGTILKVYVKDNEKVQKDQPILLLEAMKMENTVFAPVSGTIKKVYVKPGDKVPKGILMIELQ